MLPLDDIRVVDVTQVVSGPMCTSILGDMGADVIKVEPLEGDEVRYWSPGKSGLSADFVGVNRNKRSVIINLKEEKGLEIMYKLIEKSDVFVENFRPGVMSRLGLGYDKVSSINNKIVYCSISGFGQNGPYANRPAYDPIIQAMSGLIDATGEKDRPPVKVAVGIFDEIGAFYSAMAIIAALRLRDKIGKGTWIDISLLDVAVQSMSYFVSRYIALGTVPVRSGLAHAAVAPPNQGFRCKDGKYIMVSAHKENHWKAFCEVIGKPELLSDPRFSNMRLRNKNRAELIAIIEPLFLTKTRDEWVKLLLDKGVPCGPIYSIDETLADPQVVYRQCLQEIERKPLGKIKILVNPIKSTVPLWKMSYPPPLPGEHTVEVLTKLLGMSMEEVDSLMEKRVIAKGFEE